MTDITKCTNSECPLKEDCYRWTSKSNDHQQSVQLFKYNRFRDMVWCSFHIRPDDVLKPENQPHDNTH